MISEPYRQLPEWSNDGTGDASAWVTGFNGKFATLTPVIAVGGIVAVEVENLVVVSCYCSSSRKVDFKMYVGELEGVLTELKVPGKGIFLAGDLNAKSPAWRGGGQEDRQEGANVHWTYGQALSGPNQIKGEVHVPQERGNLRNRCDGGG